MTGEESKVQIEGRHREREREDRNKTEIIDVVMLIGGDYCLKFLSLIYGMLEILNFDTMRTKRCGCLAWHFVYITVVELWKKKKNFLFIF
jgi:hypothetical protein